MESLPKIAVVGFSARAAAQCAIRQGFEVIAVDACADRDLISECQAHYSLNDPNWPTALNAIYPTVPILYAGGMENRTQWIDKCQSDSLRAGSNANQMRAMRCLDNWATWAVSCDLGWPVTLRTRNEMRQVNEVYPGREWLVKPFAGAGGNGILAWIPDDPDDHISDDSIPEEGVEPASLNFPAAFYIQQHLPGEPIGVTFLSSEFGSLVIGATASWKPEPSFLGGPIYAYRGSFGPIPLSHDLLEKLQRFATRVGRESGLLGLWQADFLLYDDELTLLEINPRWSASMDILDVCLRIPLVQLHQACIFKRTSLEHLTQVLQKCGERARSSSNTMLGKLIVYAPIPFIVRPVQSDRWWSQRWSCDTDFKTTYYQFADIPNTNTSVSIGDPVLTVMASECSPDALMAKLHRGKMEVLASLEELRSR